MLAKRYIKVAKSLGMVFNEDIYTNILWPLKTDVRLMARVVVDLDKTRGGELVDETARDLLNLLAMLNDDLDMQKKMISRVVEKGTEMKNIMKLANINLKRVGYLERLISLTDSLVLWLPVSANFKWPD